MIKSLQAGRGIAAVAVLLHHAALTQSDNGALPSALNFLLPGYLGVDFFFVLSGFIIFHSTVGRGKSLTDYSLARFRRVYLPYWPVGIAFAAALLFLPSDIDWAWFATLTLFPAGGTALPPAWTLQHEVAFYAIFGALYYARLLPIGLAVWLACIAVGPDIIPFRLINLEFFFGMAACVAYRKGWTHPTLAALAVVAFVLSFVSGERVLFGLGCALLVPLIAGLEQRGRLQTPPVLVFLGAASYSIYLIHYPAIAALNRLGLGFLWISAPVALAAGLAYYWLVERQLLGSNRLNHGEVEHGLLGRRPA